MRFLAGGPSIPDELLLARDQGRVVIFCGAGVSRAKANLPDFIGLADSVVASLGVDQDSPARKLIAEAKAIDKRVGISGVISADRIFGLLEREFRSRDIELAVVSALRPPANCDLGAHQVLLDLATAPQGSVRLVTTNFDRLFDACGRKLTVWQPPRLPDPSRESEMNGIVYLHGMSTEQYDGAMGDGFVLSSSEFGRAYLADGWATSFIREIFHRYTVLFVGYSAEDPPIQYLLEALRRIPGRLHNAYAFQSGDFAEATARWQHKGVEAIAYDGHEPLWRTLDAWSKRAVDPERWYADVIDKARKGPASLEPYERGQVAHVVSTYDGIKRFSAESTVPPADWLCVFDPYRRFARPARAGGFGERGPYVDPFELYGLDSDLPPKKIDPENYYEKREVPADSWSGLALSRLDKSDLRDDNLASIEGHRARSMPRLPPRLGQMGVWISMVSDQPAAVWWASHQSGLHRDICERISWHLERSDHVSSPTVRQAWRILFESWEFPDSRDSAKVYELRATIKKDGWSSHLLRQYADFLRPRIDVRPAYSGDAVPPANVPDVKLRDLISRKIEYADEYEKIHVPDEWLVPAVKALRQNLERSLEFENEVGGYALSHISPILPDPTVEDSYQRTHGISSLLLKYCSLFSRLVSLHLSAAKQEMMCWQHEDDPIFLRLRIWVLNFPGLISGDDVAEAVEGINSEGFWDYSHQRDLLFALKARWASLPERVRHVVESKLLSGPDRWKDESDKDFATRRAWSILNRLTWLSSNECALSSNCHERMDLLRPDATDWKDERAAGAADSIEGRSGWVKTNTEHSSLLDDKLSEIIPHAKMLSGRSEFLVEKDPFKGFVTERPVRAFSALTLNAKLGKFPDWAWRTFLNPDLRKNDSKRLARLIAARIESYSSDQVSSIIRAISDWLVGAASNLATNSQAIFDRLILKLLEALRLDSEKGRSSIVRGQGVPDWAMEAINAPVGRIAQSLFDDPRKDGLKEDAKFPSIWLAHVEGLLELPGDLRRHALTIFCHNLNWFYFVDPEWTEQNLLIAIDGDDEDSDAAWSGFLWGAKIPRARLYSRLKSSLLSFAVTRERPSRRAYDEVLAGMILSGWASVDSETGNKFISNEEMHSLLTKGDSEFRLRILWQAERWSRADGKKAEWTNLIIELLRDVWPKQVSAKSPAVSARLCDLAFSAEGEDFPKVAKVVLPLLSKADATISIPHLRKSQEGAVDKFPDIALALLYEVLSEDVSVWPYGVDEIIDRIQTASPALKSDERFIVLKRRWDAR